MTRKKALGVDPLSWIKPTIDVDEEPQKAETQNSASVLPSTNKTLSPEIHQKGRNPKIPKFQTYEIKLTIRLKEEQLEFLSSLEREIKRNRSSHNRRERITKNSIMRAMIDTFRNLRIDTNEIGDENELVRKFTEITREKPRL